jgi:hypothetical protein
MYFDIEGFSYRGPTYCLILCVESVALNRENHLIKSVYTVYEQKVFNLLRPTGYVTH